MPNVYIAGTKDLSDARPVGPRRWRKQLLPLGSWLKPGSDSERFEVTLPMIKRMAENFRRGVLDSVPVPEKHTDDWRFNRGDVIALEVDERDGLFSILEVDEETDEAIRSGKVKGISASFAENYLDKKTGEYVGPVLRHACLTNLPYVKGMGGFEAALSEDDTVILLSEHAPTRKESHVDLEKIKAALKEHGIDLDAIQAAAAKVEGLVDPAKIRDGLVAAGIQLSEDASVDDMLKAVGSAVKDPAPSTDPEVHALSETIEEQGRRITQLTETLESERKSRAKERAEAMVAPYVSKGYIEPKDKDGYLSLAESQPDVAEMTLRNLAAAKGHGNILLTEVGSTEPGPDPSTTDLSEEDQEKEMERLRKVASGEGLRLASPAA